MFEANAELPTGIFKDYELGINQNQLCYISQELNLSTYTVVIKQGKPQHAAVYDLKFRMDGTKTEYCNATDYL